MKKILIDSLFCFNDDKIILFFTIISPYKLLSKHTSRGDKFTREDNIKIYFFYIIKKQALLNL